MGVKGMLVNQPGQKYPSLNNAHFYKNMHYIQVDRHRHRDPKLYKHLLCY